jgi:repressor LexA
MKIPKISLTKRQSDILNFIKSYISEKKIPPTIHVIADEFGMASTNGVYEVLKVIEKKGYINRIAKGSSRGIILNESNEKVIESGDRNDSIIKLNIIGKGESGNPVSVFLNAKGSINADKKYFKIEGMNYFAHIAEDSGMGKEGILEGDVVIIKQGKAAQSGEIVVALVRDKVYIRRIEKYSDRDELIASTRGYGKIKVKKNDKSISIFGVAIGMMKKF